MASRNMMLSVRAALAPVCLAALAIAFWQPVRADAPGVAVPPALETLPAGKQSGAAVLAGGCFWGMESVFEHVVGVTDVVSGYAGGIKAHANYEDSSSGEYDDAEAVHIFYDPSRISYTELLQIYFSVAHNPTQVDRQGPDIGPQYRSEIFATNAYQARVARAYIRQLVDASVFEAPIATRISTGERFFAAEPHHQNYAARYPDRRYIRINDAPKVEALKQHFAEYYRPRSLRLSADDQPSDESARPDYARAGAGETIQ